MLKAVIFDMDGTLVDSERVSALAWRDTMDRMNASVDAAQGMFRSFIGRTAASVTAELAEFLGGEDRAKEAFRIHAQMFDELSEDLLELKPAARESIAQLREAGLRIALATSTARPQALARLSRFDLQDAFDVITTGDEIENGKPAPDIFLKAAERLGVEPASCAVIEDSFNGVRAGHASGAHVFMVPDLVPPTPEITALCDAVLSSLEELAPAVSAVR